MPRPPVRTKQAMDAMTAYQMVHILEGVVERGTATILRDLKRPLLMLAGAIAVSAPSLWIALAGLLVFTASFFALHSTASGWVGLIAERDRAEASSMYVFCYYMGSSILGAVTGWAYEGLPWAGFVAVLVALLGGLALVSTALWKAERY